jgi:nucleotide-binding universal stress UspA family protein
MERHMQGQHAVPLVRQEAADAPFRRVVCAVDGSDGARVALAQLGRIAPATATVTIVGVIPMLAAIGWSSPGDGSPQQLAAAARSRIQRATSDGREALGGREVQVRMPIGPPADMLLHELDAGGATLVALGAHRRSRVLGYLAGSVASELIHRAPCSVLVARQVVGERPFPRSILVGVDGSDASLTAVDVAYGISKRTGARMHALVALDDDADARRARNALALLVPGIDLVEDAGDPVDALVSAGADLVVLGSRRRRGLGSLGSVGERVAHAASGSVLIVRGGTQV